MLTFTSPRVGVVQEVPGLTGRVPRRYTMNCCQIHAIEELFNDRLASKEVLNYRTKGPRQTTRMMVEAIKAKGIQGLTLLDIGGGIGAVQLELLDAGCAEATDVDASMAYLKVAKDEAHRRGVSEYITYMHGNFVELASQIQEADIVTLDRVICCYPDMRNLVSASAARARKFYSLVFPQDTLFIKIGMSILNFFLRLQKNPFRTFLHPTREVENLIAQYGFKRIFYRRTLVWQVFVFSR
jgi:hypothetical protein